jgi:Fe-S-cluster containining protein
MMKQPGRLVIFEPSDDMMELDNPVEFDGKKHTKTSVSYCPFFDRGEHRCKVYEARPMACREYPFQKVNKNQIEVRKASACLITNEFLGRFMAFLATIPNDNVTAYLKELTGIVESKQYYNHLHLPWVLVVMYLGYEFHSHKMEPLAIALLQRLDLEAKMEAEHAGTRRN